MTKMSSNVVHPKHYNSHPSGVECIDVAEDMSFNLGNALKYLWRLHHKGEPKEQIEKALFYLDREVKRVCVSSPVPPHADSLRLNHSSRKKCERVLAACYVDDDPLGIVIVVMLRNNFFYDENIAEAATRLRKHYEKHYAS